MKPDDPFEAMSDEDFLAWAEDSSALESFRRQQIQAAQEAWHEDALSVLEREIAEMHDRSLWPNDDEPKAA